MFFGSLAFIFEVMIYIGLGLPLVNLLMSVVGGGADGAGEAELGGEVSPDLGGDLGEVNLGDLDLDFDGGEPAADSSGEVFLGFDMYCLCLALVVTGACGIFSVSNFGVGTLLIAIACSILGGAFAYGLLYRLVIRPLKQNDAAALSKKTLRFRHARVTFRIEEDSPGQIQTWDAGGAVISYRAQLDPAVCKLSRIETGEEVIITEIKKEESLCYVTLAQRKVLS